LYGIEGGIGGGWIKERRPQRWRWLTVSPQAIL
jgi:hypothetical protein